jgi:hypothetical protein
MKTKILTLAAALLLAAVSNSQANIISGTFSGLITSTSGSPSGNPQIGNSVSGNFSYDSSLLSGGRVTYLGFPGSDLSARLRIAVDGGIMGVGSSFVGGYSPLFMQIGADGLPVDSYAANGTFTGRIGFSGGVGTGVINNDLGSSGGVSFSITSYTLTGFNAPDASATLALMGLALSGLAGFKRFVR